MVIDMIDFLIFIGGIIFVTIVIIAFLPINKCGGFISTIIFVVLEIINLSTFVYFGIQRSTYEYKVVQRNFISKEELVINELYTSGSKNRIYKDTTVVDTRNGTIYHNIEQDDLLKLISCKEINSIDLIEMTKYKNSFNIKHEDIKYNTLKVNCRS